MAIDYFIQYPCKVRGAVTDSELLEMLKAKSNADTTLEIMRNHPRTDRSRPESEWAYVSFTRRPEGTVERRVRIHDLLVKAEPLNTLSHYCVGCPANLANKSFGCGGTIFYPIEQASEQWLVDRLPTFLNSPEGRMLCMAIRDFNFDGLVVDRARARSELYAAPAPVVRKWGGLLSRKVAITSSQVVHMLIGAGHLDAAQAQMVARFLGFADRHKSLAHLPVNRVGADEWDGIAQFKRYLAALAYCGSNDLSMFVDA